MGDYHNPFWRQVGLFLKIFALFAHSNQNQKLTCGLIWKSRPCPKSIMVSFKLNHYLRITETKSKNGNIIKRHSRKQNPEKLENFYFGDVTERHLRKQNPVRNPETRDMVIVLIFLRLLGISTTVIYGNKIQSIFGLDFVSVNDVPWSYQVVLDFISVNEKSLNPTHDQNLIKTWFLYRF